MKYDDSMRLYYFSTEQTTSYEEKQIVKSHELEVIVDAFKNKEFAVPGERAEGPQTPAGKAVTLIIGIGSFFGIVGALMAKSYKLAAIFGAVLMIFFGVMALMGKTRRSRNINSYGTPLTPPVSAAVCFSIGLGLLIPLLLSGSMESIQCVKLGSAIMCFGGFISAIVSIIDVNKRVQNIFTDEIEAKCVGYIKKAVRTKNRNHTRTRIVGCPVFTYMYKGIEHQASEYIFTRGMLKPAYGETATILVDPEDPDEFLSLATKKSTIKSSIVAAVILIIAGAVLVATMMI